MKEIDYIPLHNYIAQRLNEEGCSNALLYAAEYIVDNGLDPESSIEFLEANGGYCDCEVMMNVTPRVQDGTAVESRLEDTINALDLGWQS